MADETPDAVAEALAGMLPPDLTPAQRARFAALATVVRNTVARVPHAKDEFVEPAGVFDLQVRWRAEATKTR